MDGPWIGVDLDGCLAVYNGWGGICSIGEPVPKMVARVKEWLRQGYRVKIMTARASDPDPDAIPTIRAWSLKHLGVELEVTATKDYEMISLWDDRAVRVYQNTGEVLHASCKCGHHNGVIGTTPGAIKCWHCKEYIVD